jgi:Flp pilus assembly protein TadG
MPGHALAAKATARGRGKGCAPFLVTNLSNLPCSRFAFHIAFTPALAAARCERHDRLARRTRQSRRYPMRPIRKSPAQRRGTAVVETAVVLPIYLLLIFAIIEIGHATMVVNLLQSGCRSAARMGSMQGPNTSQVIEEVRRTLGTAVNPNVVNVFVQDASSMDSGAVWPTTDAEVQALPPMEVSEAEPRQMFVVRASVNYNDVSVLPMPFLAGVTLDAQAFMRHE